MESSLALPGPSDKLYCMYRVNGCKDMAFRCDLGRSKRGCPFRTITCPMCKWTGPAKTYEMHVRNIFKKDREYFPLLLDNKGSRVIKSDGEIYVLGYTYDNASGTANFSLTYVGPVQKCAGRYFRMFVKDSKGEGFEERRQIGDARMWDMTDLYKVVIYLDVLGLTPNYGNDELVDVCVAVENRIPVFPKDILSSLLKELSCKHCNRFSKGLLFQQGTGGSSIICDECRQLMDDADLIRNISLEFVCNNFLTNDGKDFDEKVLLKGLECPVCMEYMFPPIKNCVNGHSVCCSCRSFISSCPVCRDKLSYIRNIGLEVIYKKMHYRCISFDFGCQFTNVANLIPFHEMECPF